MFHRLHVLIITFVLNVTDIQYEFSLKLLSHEIQNSQPIWYLKCYSSTTYAVIVFHTKVQYKSKWVL